MIQVYSYDQLGQANHGWLQARHHFNFAEYFNPQRMNFGVLRVINDDTIRAGTGFDTHPHDNMEIITYVRKGAITHRDSVGNEGRTAAGDVQVMSAGTGIRHSEHNCEATDTTLYQIWIEPNQHNVEPRWEAQQFPNQPVEESLNLLVSGDGEAPLFIYQDARIYAGRLTAGTLLSQAIKHQAYVLVSKGEIQVEDKTASQGDGVAITDLRQVNLQSLSDAEILLIDVPPPRS